MTQIRLVKPDKTTRTSVDTIEITPALVKRLKLPPFQRPLRANAKVLEVAEELKRNGGVFPGILTIGVLKGEQYLVDGQHRCYAFELSGLELGYSDVRFRHYDSLEDMAEDFVRLNSVLVKMRPDDILRGLESSSDALSLIRTKCAFVGYDQIRRGTTSPIVSMSQLLRCWFGAGRESPGAFGMASTEMLKALSLDEARECVGFLELAVRAWGRDPEYYRLWSSLNLTLCLWIYRRVVLRSWSAKTPKMSRDMFCKCLGMLSASPDYVEWLLGRNMNDRDRSPCYRRIKQCFVRRIELETGKKASFPAPEWAST